jgi:hypothetical protein
MVQQEDSRAMDGWMDGWIDLLNLYFSAMFIFDSRPEDM